MKNNMKLVGYIKEFKECMFTIPIYSDGEEYFFHVVNDDYRILDFIHITDLTNFIEKEIKLDFNIGDVGAVVFVGFDNHLIYGKIRAILDIEKYLDKLTEETKFLSVKDDVSYFKKVLYEE